MELRHALTVLTRWWWLLLLGALVAAGAAFFVTRSQPPVYRATSTLFVNYTSGPGTLTYSDALLNQMLVKTFSQMIGQPVILERVQQELRLPYDSAALRRVVSVRPVRDTQLIEIAVEDNHPAQARNIANAVATAFIAEQTPFLPSEPAGTSLRVAQPALLPTEPIGPRLLFNVGLAIFLGLLLMAGMIALIEYLDDSVATVERVVRATGLVTLATIPVVTDRGLALVGATGRPARTGVPPGDGNPGTGYYNSTSEEAFRLLRANLQVGTLEQPLRSLLVTSARPGDGKTTVATNLAIVLAQGGQRVILLDADLRRPELHNRFHVRNRAGFSTLLSSDEARIQDLLQGTSTDNLFLLTSGPLPPNPSELLASTRLQRCLPEIEELADIVVIDSPPVLAVSDPVVLSQAVDGVLVVANAQATRASDLSRACAMLEQAGGRVLGVSLNKLREQKDSYYHYGTEPSGPREVEPAPDPGAGLRAS